MRPWATTFVLTSCVVSAPARADGPGLPSPSPTPPRDNLALALGLYQNEKLWDAAASLHRVAAGETGEGQTAREIAEFHLGKAFYKLNLLQAAYSVFGDIADRPVHVAHAEALLWLGKLAEDLPDPAGVVDRVGQYGEEDLAKFDNPEQRTLLSELRYLLGRSRYAGGRYAEAGSLFEKVDRRSRYYARAQLYEGISNVRLHQSKPAIEAFRRAAAAAEERDAGSEDAARMRDLANLSIARTYYSATIVMREEEGQWPAVLPYARPVVDATRLSAAVKYWDKVDLRGEYGLDALFEEAWAYFIAGNYGHALGLILTLQSPYFPHAYYPEAALLEAIIYFANCRYSEGMTLAARFHEKYAPVRDALQGLQSEYGPSIRDDALYEFLTGVRAGRWNRDEAIAPMVREPLGDRALLRDLDSVSALDQEQSRLENAPASFRSSTAAEVARDSIRSARDVAVREAGYRARVHYDRDLRDLEESLHTVGRLHLQIVRALRQMLDQNPALLQQEQSKVVTVEADREHVLWPFTGEYWRDELGSYRQVLESRCGR